MLRSSTRASAVQQSNLRQTFLSVMRVAVERARNQAKVSQLQLQELLSTAFKVYKTNSKQLESEMQKLAMHCRVNLWHSTTTFG